MKAGTALGLILDELDRTSTNNKPFNSPHEGFAVLKEEVDELWDEVKANRARTHRGASEAVQVAAMAMRFLVDICPDEAAVEHGAKIASYTKAALDFGHGESGGYSG